ncbi:MAG: transglutaminase-like domain-containing protein [Candidatus Micrarchaeota archaeon]|nr:transglutaminase-like domain-containing protein [Candidatus Micrarchaeota archaeon]
MRIINIIPMLLTLSIIFADGQFIPQLITSATVLINESGSVIVHGGAIEDLSLQIQVPASTEYQSAKVDAQKTFEKEGNRYVQIGAKKPKNPFHYSFAIHLNTTKRMTQDIGGGQLADNEARYLQATNRTQSDHPKIRALADKIVEGSVDDFEKVAKIAIWVHNNVKYNEQYVGEKKDAISILETKEGVCFEYATLFAALSRAAGFPTRYVTGYVFSEKYGTWQGHAWNEVYLGKWMPVDPTWLEVGRLDALHVELGKFFEIEETNLLVANYFPKNARIEWETSGKSGPMASNIVLLDFKQDEPKKDYSFDIAAKRLPPKSATAAFLEIEGKEYAVIPVTLSTCVGLGAFEVETPTKHLILRPNVSTVASWIVKVPANISPSYQYSCPLTLNSPYLEKRSISVRVDPRAERQGTPNARLYKDKVKIGEKNTIIFQQEASGKNGSAYVFIGNQISKIDMLETPYYDFYSGKSQGKQKILLAYANGDLQWLEYEISNASVEEEGLKIEEISLPAAYVEGRQANLTFAISAKEYPQTVTIAFAYGSQKSAYEMKIEKPVQITISVLPEFGLQEPISLAVKGATTSTSYHKFINVKKQPTVKVADTSITKISEGTYEVKIKTERQNMPKNLTIRIDDGETTAIGEEDEINFVLQEGKHKVWIGWQDEVGSWYEINQTLDIGGSPKKDGSICMPLIIILVAAFGGGLQWKLFF